MGVSFSVNLLLRMQYPAQLFALCGIEIAILTGMNELYLKPSSDDEARKSGAEEESLEKQVNRAEQEARMVLPGIQALFGFQLVAVFNSFFFEALTRADRLEHLAALVGSALSALLIMTPAAYHRQAEQGCASKKFVKLASNLTCFAMLMLASAVTLDLDLILRLILEESFLAHAIAVILFLGYLGAWFVFPHVSRQKTAPALHL